MTARQPKRSPAVARAGRSAAASGLIDGWRPPFLLAALVLITLAAYYPALHGGLLWDDDAHLTRRALRSVDGLRRIWFDIGATQQYYPVVHSAFWVFHRLWGDHTLGYHLVNVLLHATSAFLFALILRRLAMPGAALAALLFAVHPVHVESVAWITELKNTLSGVLYLGAALALLRFDRDRQRAAYLLALVLFALALLAKSVTATLPAAVLLLLWWQRGRLRWREDAAPLLPFFALGIGSGLMTAWVERAHIGAEGAAFDLTLIERALVAGHAVWFYLGKIAWPANLIFVYPRWEISQTDAVQYLYPLSVLVLMGTLWMLRHRSRGPLAALLFFIGTLFPALGFFNVYPFIYSFVADHFQYLASLGIIALFSAAVTASTGLGRAAVRLIGWGLVLTAAALTWQQSRPYVDATTLYRETLERNPNAWMAHINLGWLQLRALTEDRATASETPQLEEAAAHFREALRLKPDLRQAQNNLGTTLLRLGRYEEALAAYRAALTLKPDDPDVHVNLGVLLEQMGRYDEAVGHDREAVRLDPARVEAYLNLGTALGRQGNTAAAATAFGDALRLDPTSVDAHRNLGIALLRLGRTDEALARLEEAARLRPGTGAGYLDLARAFLSTGRREEAVSAFRQALRIEPGVAETHNELGVILAELGRREEAVAAFREALRLAPDFEDARVNLARVSR